MKALRKKEPPVFRYVFGPVYSWRLGISLGIDPVSTDVKTCPFDCVYCQLGKTRKFSCERRVFIPTRDILREVKAVPAARIDYITFSGRGEPTLAKNLGLIIRAIKKIRKERIAVITNAVLMGQKSVRDDLSLADFVLAKLDAWDEESLSKINRPHDVNFKRILRGIKEFQKIYKGRLALQIMFLDQNKNYADRLALIARDIRPDEIQINTPLRKSPVKPLGLKVMRQIRRAFVGMKVRMVYQSDRKNVRPLDTGATEQRHGRQR